MVNSGNENDKLKLHRFEKNNYFYGKLMTVRDFETEQSYIDEKRHLINRLLHGSGIVCGFEDLQIENKGDKIMINFIDGGMALDCCGREIVVPANTLGKPILDSGGNSVPDLTASPYLYLKYNPCYDGYVAAASNPSSCEERCCPGRLIEDFDVVASNDDPDSTGVLCHADFPDGPEVIADAVRKWLDALEKAHLSCPLCGGDQKYKILLGKVQVEEGGFSVNRFDTQKHRIFFTQKELYQLLKCHILDFDNPHDVTASQTGALVSIKGVSNPGGDVDLVQDNSIVIIPDDTNNRITIGETHSPRKDNPHEVTAAQTGALVSVRGVGNPGGNIDLIAGANISITPNPGAHTIEIASTGGIQPGITVKSVGTNLIVGTSDKYSREDHVHNLEKKVVDFVNLSETLQKQLNLLFMYLRERALKCTVSTFKATGEKFEIDIAFETASVTKKAVDTNVYEEERKFIDFVTTELLPLMKQFKDKISGRVTEDSFTNLSKSLDQLDEALDSDDPLNVSIKQDEVCFYVTELEIRG